MSFSMHREGDITVVDVGGQLIVGNRQELKQKGVEIMDSPAGTTWKVI